MNKKSKFFTGVKNVVKEEPTVEVKETVVEEEVVVEPEVEVVEEPVSEGLPNVSFGLCKNPTDNKFYVVKITFNLETGAVGKVETIENPVVERFTAIERFKINVAKSGMLN